MRKTGMMAMMAAAIFQLASCSMGNKVDVNGEKIELEDGVYAKISTTKGDILIDLDTKNAPMTTANFVMLAEGTMPEVKEEYQGKPYFNGLKFHRVIPNFMIQGGDPQGNGQGGPGYQFPNETSPELSHKKGVISMANAGPNTNGSQFFITVADVQRLDGGYSIFGSVLEGQSVADSISMVKTGQADKPEEDVVMNEVSIIRVGGDYKDWDALAAFNKGKEDFEIKQKEEQERMRKEQEEAQARAAALQAELAAKYPDAKTSESGLMYIIEDVGSGEKPADGAKVNVHYAGYLADGKMFDTSIKALAEENNLYNPQREPYNPMPMVYGPQAQMIPGFKEGVNMLNIGGKAKLIIPPSLAYGASGAGGVIPPHAWLIFDIELVSFVK